MNGPGWNPAVEPTLRIRPLLRAIISWRKARVRVRSETMFTWIISSERCRSISAKGPLVPKPALFTRKWIWRPSRRTSSTTCPAASGDERSAAITCACRPRASRSSFAIASRRSRLRATSTTSCPSAANSCAYSEPSPADAPVMSTTLAELAMTLDLPVPLQRPDVRQRPRDRDHLALRHLPETFGTLRAGEHHRRAQHPVRLHLRIELVRRRSDLVPQARDETVDHAHLQRMSPPQRRHHTPVAHHRRQAGQRLADLLERALRLADRGRERAGRGVGAELVVVETADVAQTGKEGEEEPLRRRVSFHRAAQVVRQRLQQHGTDRGERIRLAGDGEEPALETEGKRDLLVERPRRRPDGAAADQRCLALDAVGELLRQRGLPAERPLAQQQIVALEKSDTGGPLRRSERNLAGEPAKYASEKSGIRLVDGEELCQNENPPVTSMWVL